MRAFAESLLSGSLGMIVAIIGLLGVLVLIVQSKHHDDGGRAFIRNTVIIFAVIAGLFFIPTLFKSESQDVVGEESLTE